MTDVFELSVVVPCYNEALNISLIIDRFKKVIDVNPETQIILVDNGSTDESQFVISTLLRELSENYSGNFKLVHVELNQGYGYGIMMGLMQAGGKLLSWTHADMQTDPLDIIAAYKMYNQEGGHKVLVKGKRKGRALADEFFTWGMQKFCYAALKISINDINAQPKLFNRQFYDDVLNKYAPHDFSLDLYILYHAKKLGYSVLEIPVVFSERKFGKAKGGGSWKTKFKLIKRTIAYILELRVALRNSR